ncbi:hypothetical protein [Chryseobacterium sp. CCH4-E10]|jgi:hypothetical protein|uniref:hypothetical protein n=1 Tax=Chryseobacterium sp. CCH4-E10 TaxID=1768758 RepID=UPI00082E1133|nr:hypothetical protein [Chryseobacterium sp. CCH4-E10]
MKKVIFGMFLLAGTTFGFANNTTTTPTVNKASSEKVSVIGKTYTIKSVTYDDNGKCTVKASFNNGSSSGTITVTADTCAKAAAAISAMLQLGGL